jgi:hypothetical protein
VKTFQELLKVHLGAGRNIRVSYKWWFKIYLWFKGKEYKDRRWKILTDQAGLRSHLRMKRAMESRSYIFEEMAKYPAWKGGKITVPFYNK